MTLTPLVVNAARHRLVLAAGPDKAVAVERWLLGDPDVPVHHVRRSDTVVVIDQAAARPTRAAPAPVFAQNEPPIVTLGAKPAKY